MSASRPRYRVLFDLAEGGMGVVSVGLLQSDRGFQRMVALKRIHREVTDDDAARRALLREAHLASLIRDPGIVSVHELVEQDGELLVVMELVEGVSLRTLLNALEDQRRRLPVAIAARILEKCARALEAAHDATDPTTGAPLRVVHRDISPQNVLVSFRGEVKIADFGIAKALEQSGESTRPGTLRGKPAYVAPEQVTSRAVDARTDLWSLGVVGYELFTGTRLFRGRSDAETLDRLLHAEIPSLTAERSDVPPAIAEVLSRALMRDPAARWASARAMGDAIENAMGQMRARREDVADLVTSVLGDEQRSFAARVRRAMSEPERLLGSGGAAREHGAGSSRPVLRFFAFMTAGLALTAALRMGWAAWSTPRVETTAPAVRVIDRPPPRRVVAEVRTRSPTPPAPAVPPTPAPAPTPAPPQIPVAAPPTEDPAAAVGHADPPTPQPHPSPATPPPVRPRTSGGASGAARASGPPAGTPPAGGARAHPPAPPRPPSTPPPTRPTQPPAGRPAWMEFPL